MISVILCGGVGARLWPISREMHPVPFLQMPDGQSLLHKTLLRSAGIKDMKKIITVTGKNCFFKVENEYITSGIKIDSEHILEPFGRNTAPAIALAALSAQHTHGDDVLLLVLPADHFISEPAAFFAAVDEAKVIAMRGEIVVFGVTPSSPETDYGYIKEDAGKVIQFTEKPNIADAINILESGSAYWNSGILCFTVATFLRELMEHAPDLLKSAQHCFDSALRGETKRKAKFLEITPSAFETVPNISIDYSLLEKSHNVSIVKCGDVWADLGSWPAFFSQEIPNSGGNHIIGDHDGNIILEDVTNSNVYSSGRLVSAIGVDNLLIVDTGDAVLVCDKNQSNNAKKIYNEIKAKNKDEYKHHNTVHRPWGSFTLLETGNRFKIKRLVLHPNAAISFQLHHHRHEHWIVVSGMAEVTCEDRTFYLDSNESTYIKAGKKHRVANNGTIDLVIIEVQSGDYLGEDDIVRFDDIYGRVAD